MQRTLRVFAVAFCMLACLTEAAQALPISARLPPRIGKHCLGEPKAKLLFDQFLGAQFNALGVEHTLHFSLCVPLIHSDRPLFAFTYFEAGVMNYLSPIYDYQGVFVGITPLSILRLRAEFSGLTIWPFRLFDAAGYFGLPTYDADFSRQSLTKDIAQSAFGLNVALTAVLQGKVPLGSRASLLMVFATVGDYHYLGQEQAMTAPYYWNPRRDVVLASSDWLVKITAVLLAEVNLTDNIALRVGGTDDFVTVPSSGYQGNIAAGLLGLFVNKVRGPMRNLMVFTRLGVHTHHQFRNVEFAGVNAVVGFSAQYEVRNQL